METIAGTEVFDRRESRYLQYAHRQTMDTTILQQDLGLTFADAELLRQAMVHPSYLNERPDEVAGSNQRLEFLGDAVIGLVVARELYRRHPDVDEGVLTEARAQVVQGKTLARVARGLGLGRYLLLGQGEEAGGGGDRDSNLAAALEALVGAVLLDRGYRQAQRFVLRVLGPELETSAPDDVRRDPKSWLQELAHRQGGAAPEYEVVSTAGPPHQPVYTVTVELNGEVLGTGQGRRKVDAERGAAREALKRME
jgi:ribonuclease-3